MICNLSRLFSGKHGPSVKSTSNRFVRYTHRYFCYTAKTANSADITSSLGHGQGGNTMPQVPDWLKTLRTEYVDKIQMNTAKRNTYDIHIFDPARWTTMQYLFPQESWNPNEMTGIHKRRLSLGDESKHYTQIGEVFSFPSAEDHPIIHESNTPAKIWWEIGSKTPKILLQLNEHFPPSLWLSIAPKLDAIRTLSEEFLQIDSKCMHKNLKDAEESHEKYLQQLGGGSSNVSEKKHQLKDLYLNELRQKDPASFNVDWENDVCIYLGSHNSLAQLERDWMRTNPFIFGWPLLLSDGNSYMEKRSTHLAAFRTLMSKSILLLVNHRDISLNNRGDTAECLTSETPTFVFVNYPKNKCLCGGEAFVKRFNSLMGTKLPTDLPVDVLALLAREQIVKTVEQIVDETSVFESVVTKGPESERHPRLPAILQSSTRAVGQMAYNIMYLACMQYQDWDTLFSRLAQHKEATIRLALAKGSMLLGRDNLVRDLAKKEEDYETRCVLLKLLESP
ncbi:hypothetical protein XU18_4854 [Perkinsela sp. CCAP 1560/4]|nr:hypothetical protein XU18_4854 [Perkinsela sp. CCAP 1560/4]|eukprot:KNH03778.1 hypothetical protein XU18_4854 [Perkinsela sp. CCAP 1560/4]